ncbi:hypothetical protein SAMN06269185_2860 [Natronoarchaeum philippinense]|uniref:Halobacterial output domain-containing protein n=1 Tax=Natronoarchaeum philippinense TaxID=558529 RepID=A0A285PA76_NATPI|nr:HalOD1 output domain-containing protein [Natronoarchaeum philippinense]SNZ17036.1 hypothetical protein SAMN06269185_2860 [Natronoarchaeum philippinense]
MTESDETRSRQASGGGEQAQSASSRVVSAVAAETDRDQSQMPPLYDAVDPDALDALLDRPSTAITFRYAGRDVTVHADGGIETSVRRE